ncbi:NAD(P)-dependent oxidoreductase [Brevibacterium luteolum]|nr:NAD(P)-dependent oxidoreductase [Brevibacterium luteolum]
MRVVVTGAAGYVGQAIARRLVESGRRVTSVGLDDPQISGVEHHAWDIREEIPAQLQGRLRFTDAVVHAAVIDDDWAAEDELQAVNVTGTRHVLDAFPNPRMICLSSTAVYAPADAHRQLYEEGGPVDPHRYLCAYERSRAEAERVIARVQPEALVLRPNAVYGPEDTTLWPVLERAADKGVLRLPDGGKHTMTMTHIDTLTAAVDAALTKPQAYGPMNIGDPQPYIVHEALTTYLGRFGHPSLELDSIAVDLSLVKAWFAERLARRKKRRPPYTRHTMRNLAHERTYSLSRMHRLLGIDGVQGLRRSGAAAGQVHRRNRRS